MRAIICIVVVLFTNNSRAFESSFADSLLQEASLLETESGLEFMLDNYYSVLNKSFKDGQEWGQITLDYAKTSGNRLLEGRAYMNLGTVWYLSGDYEKCIENFQQAETIFESLQNDQFIGRLNNEMSIYYRKQKQFDVGLACLDKSFASCTKSGDMICVETSLNNRGVIYEMQGKFDLALTFYRRAQRVAIDNDNDIGLSYIYSNLGECHRLMENYDSTEYYVNLSSDIRLKLDDQQGMAMNHTNLAETLILARKLEKGKIYLDKGLALSQEIGYLDLERQLYKLYFEYYKAKNNPAEAFRYLEMSHAIGDSLIGVEKLRTLSEMEVRYETEKVEKNFAVEQQLRSQAELKVANRNNWLLATGASVLFIAFISVLAYQRKMRRKEEEKNAAILLEKQRGLEAVFDATEEERQRIAKDLHDGVGQQMSGLKLAWENLSVELLSLDETKVEKLKTLSNILDETASEVREISHQMMPKVLTELGLVSAINEMLDKSLILTNVQYEFEHFNIEGRFSDRIEISLYRITQELVNNVIKHSGANHLSVQLFKNKNQLILIVEDNGSGFNSTGGEGHGLLNIKSRLNTISGKVNYEASSDRGTMATIRVDLSQENTEGN